MPQTPTNDAYQLSLAADLAAIPLLSSAAVRDILACPWDVFHALMRHAQRVEDALRERLHKEK